MVLTANGAARMMTPILVFKNCSRRNSSGVSLVSNTGGFTLLEILLVLAIMAMASLVVVPSLTGLESRTFSAQVREAHSLLNYARRIAVVSGQPSTASFYIGNGDSIEIEDSQISRTSVGRWNSDGTSVTYRDSTDRDIEVEDKIEITFFPEGGSTGGSLILFSQERAASINVDPFTGRIKTELLDDI